jgi:hypothetical protein
LKCWLKSRRPGRLLLKFLHVVNMSDVIPVDVCLQFPDGGNALFGTSRKFVLEVRSNRL